MHYKAGACAGLQMAASEELNMKRKAVRVVATPAKYGAIGLVAAGAVVGGVVALGVAIPVAGVALPVYGAWRLKQRRARKKLAVLEEVNNDWDPHDVANYKRGHGYKY